MKYKIRKGSIADYVLGVLEFGSIVFVLGLIVTSIYLIGGKI